MLSKEVVELSKQHSIIRDIFEYGMKRAKEVGAENVFDFSIGNPSVPAPKEIDETALRLLKTADPVDIHGYTSNAGVLEVRENIAKSLNKRFDTNYTAANIFMTIGAAAALGICFKTLVDGPEDEVITFAPHFPEYAVYAQGAGCRCGILLPATLPGCAWPPSVRARRDPGRAPHPGGGCSAPASNAWPGRRYRTGPHSCAPAICPGTA